MITNDAGSSSIQPLAKTVQFSPMPAPATPKKPSGNRLSGFINALKSSPSDVASGIESMAGALKTSFENAPRAAEVFGSELVRGVRKEAATPGTPGHAFMNTPLLGLGNIVPGGQTRVGRFIESSLLPSPKHLTSDVTEVAKHPSLGNVAAVGGDVLKIATAPMVLSTAVRGVGVGARGVAAGAERAGGLASELGRVGGKPGFMKSAEEIFTEGRAAARAKAAASAVAKMPAGVAERETGLVWSSRAARAASGMVREGAAKAAPAAEKVAEPVAEAAAPAAEGAASAAKEAAKAAVPEAKAAAGKGNVFTRFVKGAAGSRLNPVESVKASASAFKGAAEQVVKTVTKPEITNRPASAPVRLAGSAALTGLKVAHGAGELVIPAAEAAGVTAVVRAKLAPSAKTSSVDAATSQAAKNVGMTTEEFKGIISMTDVQRQALVRGLKKAQRRGLSALEGMGQSSRGGAKTAARTLLKESVSEEMSATPRAFNVK